ncbi:tho complex subunit 7 homolog [Stylonychia lemnae]|uniref:Tho complex subunit 7 homolog n=1 Tax=Stylonychia lemnae TaxID=5949 RepID=A0A078B2D2_STYLE|nr:tho complex subunit 7 homolog [Stylonychia lemnae]|eukprot:CDW88391.1 tho complex subunit 7 homolog [Stylonychia lemnae]
MANIALTEQQYDEIFKQKIVMPKFNLGVMTYNILSKFDTLSEEQLLKQVEDMYDEVEENELKLLKAETQFNMRASDALYHQEISREITKEIASSKSEMAHLQRELELQKQLKAQKAEYEIIAKAINEFPSQEESLKIIDECAEERECFEVKSKDDEIILKQKQLHALREYDS